MKFFLSSVCIFFFASLIFVELALADSSGRVGRDSTGTASVSLSIPESIGARPVPTMQFSNADEKGFPRTKSLKISSSAEIQISSNSDQEAGAYSLMGFGSGENAQFELQNTASAARAIAYEVLLVRGDETLPSPRLSPLRAETILANASRVNEATLRVEMAKLPQGEPFSGTLTLVLMPQ